MRALASAASVPAWPPPTTITSKRKLDVSQPGSMEAVIEKVGTEFGQIDFAIHSMAFCNADDLHGRVIDTTEEGFDAAMNVSCHSFLRMAKALEPLMSEGGSLITMSYLGAERVVRNYGVMGIIKAALESAVRYMAYDLGPKGIRVFAVSPGPIMTRAASGITNFNQPARSRCRQGAARPHGDHRRSGRPDRLPVHLRFLGDDRPDHLRRRRSAHRRLSTQMLRSEKNGSRAVFRRACHARSELAHGQPIAATDCFPTPYPDHPLLNGRPEIGRGESTIVLDGDVVDGQERVFKVLSSPTDYAYYTATTGRPAKHFPVVFRRSRHGRSLQSRLPLPHRRGRTALPAARLPAMPPRWRPSYPPPISTPA
jgi:NAD(P)-dependent dehydrogenase (short-subunit alcohol dehydrogenase family)